MPSTRIGRPAAILLVFGTSAAVLVLEILAGRLLAPYVGVSLETYTGIIGTCLAAIAVGTALGGRLADRLDARRLIGPSIVLGGALAWLSLPVLSALGPSSSEGPIAIVTLTTFAFFLPAAVLSAVSPMVAKLRLDDVAHTGEVVGSLSAAGTAGALCGTFLTGFVLVAAWPTRPIVIFVGAALVLTGVVVWFLMATSMPRRTTTLLVVVGLAASAGLAAADPTPCRWETAYFCANVEHDPRRPDGRILVLDTLRHSYVDLADPTHLEFRYMRLFADVVDVTAPDGRAVDALHLGGGGFTFPRYLAATRPGSRNRVLEIDAGLVRIAEDQLGLVQGPDLEVVVGDARLHLDELADDSHDLVVGDAFGGLSVPWHLTTEEVLVQVARVLRDDGTYVVNVIDGGPERFARAHAATMAAVFPHVVAVAPPTAPGGPPVNHVLVGSDEPIDERALAAAIDGRDGRLRTGQELHEWIGGARVLTDDLAPVDQLLTRR